MSPGRSATSKVRRDARVLALLVLYEADTARHQPGDVLARHLSERGPDNASSAYAQQLVSGVVKERVELDAVLARCAPDHPFDDVAAIDRNVLRIALHEITSQSAPAKVAINEAVEIAKAFGSEAAPRFINGVLAAALNDPAVRAPTETESTR